jgi:hypothetical protein
MARKLVLLGVVVAVAAMVAAPIVLGHGNKPGSSTAKIGAGEVKVDFTGPESKGRDVLSLLPPGGYWRMGADRATTFTTDVALKFGDMTVPKGSYTLVAHFDDNGNWSLIVADAVGSGSKPTKVVGKAAGTIEKLDAEVENMVIKLEASGDKGKLVLDWGTARLTAEFSAA